MNEITEAFKKEITRNFKPVQYITIENDLYSDRQNSGEYSVLYKPLIMGSGKDFSENKRSKVLVTIRFEDNTGMKMYLEPEDYLSKIRTHEFETKLGFGATGTVINNFRDIDYSKALKTILSSLKGEKVENMSFETLDYLITE